MHVADAVRVGVQWSWHSVKGAYILVHQTGLADTTITQDNDLDCQSQRQFHEFPNSHGGVRRTLRRTFFLEDMVKLSLPDEGGQFQ